MFGNCFIYVKVVLLLFFYLYMRRIAVIAKKFENEVDLKEPWYGTEYKMIKIPDSALKVIVFNRWELLSYAFISCLRYCRSGKMLDCATN